MDPLQLLGRLELAYAYTERAYASVQTCGDRVLAAGREHVSPEDLQALYASWDAYEAVSRDFKAVLADVKALHDRMAAE